MRAEEMNLQLIKDLTKRVERLEQRTDPIPNNWSAIAEEYRGKVLNLESLLYLVCDYFNQPVHNVKSRSRVRDYSIPRSMYMYFGRKHKARLSTTLAGIGRLVNVGHSDVSIQGKKYADLAPYDPEVKEAITEIDKVIEGMI